MILTSAAMSQFKEETTRGVSLPVDSFLSRSTAGAFPGRYEVFPAEEFASVGNIAGEELKYVAYDIRPVGVTVPQAEDRKAVLGISGRMNKAAVGPVNFRDLFHVSASVVGSVYDTRAAARTEAARLNRETYDSYLTDCQNHELAGTTGWRVRMLNGGGGAQQPATASERHLTAA